MKRTFIVIANKYVPESNQNTCSHSAKSLYPFDLNTEADAVSSLWLLSAQSIQNTIVLIVLTAQCYYDHCKHWMGSSRLIHHLAQIILLNVIAIG